MNWMETAQQTCSLAIRRSSAFDLVRSGIASQSDNFLVHSVNAIAVSDELEAQHLEATATYLEMEMVVKAGVAAGEWNTYLVGHNREVGKYIQVQTEQGWNPDYFWCEDPASVTADSAALM